MLSIRYSVKNTEASLINCDDIMLNFSKAKALKVLYINNYVSNIMVLNIGSGARIGVVISKEVVNIMVLNIGSGARL
ncbi:MAG: hypothetical protein ACOCRK_07320 [bacterium]